MSELVRFCCRISSKLCSFFLSPLNATLLVSAFYHVYNVMLSSPLFALLFTLGDLFLFLLAHHFILMSEDFKIITSWNELPFIYTGSKQFNCSLKTQCVKEKKKTRWWCHGSRTSTCIVQGYSTDYFKFAAYFNALTRSWQTNGSRAISIRTFYFPQRHTEIRKAWTEFKILIREQQG